MIDALLTWFFGTIQQLGPLNLGIICACLLSMTGACAVIYKKAGFSSWWAVLQLLPFINVLALVILAALPWPALDGRDQDPA